MRSLWYLKTCGKLLFLSYDIPRGEKGGLGNLVVFCTVQNVPGKVLRLDWPETLFVHILVLYVNI